MVMQMHFKKQKKKKGRRTGSTNKLKILTSAHFDNAYDNDNDNDDDDDVAQIN